MNSEKTKVDDLKGTAVTKMNGIVLVQESSIEKKYRIDETASSPEIGQFLESLPEEYELSFYDRFYPSISDPGAYVYVQRKGSIIAYWLGNHGWSSDLLKQSIELMAAYITINAKGRRGKLSPFILTVRKAVRNAFSQSKKDI